MSSVRWEDPPPHGNTGKKRTGMQKYRGAVDILRKHPGRWGVIAQDIPTGTAGALSSRIRLGSGAFAPRGAFESRCAGSVGGKAKVYARYVGEAS